MIVIEEITVNKTEPQDHRKRKLTANKVHIKGKNNYIINNAK